MRWYGNQVHGGNKNLDFDGKGDGNDNNDNAEHQEDGGDYYNGDGDDFDCDSET